MFDFKWVFNFFLSVFLSCFWVKSLKRLRSASVGSLCCAWRKEMFVTVLQNLWSSDCILWRLRIREWEDELLRSYTLAIGVCRISGVNFLMWRPVKRKQSLSFPWLIWMLINNGKLQLWYVVKVKNFLQPLHLYFG